MNELKREMKYAAAEQWNENNETKFEVMLANPIMSELSQFHSTKADNA